MSKNDHQSLDNALYEKSVMKYFMRDDEYERLKEFETDNVLNKIYGEISAAIIGRYKTFLGFYEDEKNWAESQPHLRALFGEVQLEPWTAAVALAIRPGNIEWGWDLVERWSWVYRHAALLGIEEADFEDWLEYQRPDSSAAFVTAQLIKSGRAPTIASSATHA